MTNYFVFDCEIKKCIPDREGSMDVNLDYCEGWHDHANMGVSVVGIQPCGWSAPIAWVDEAYTGEDSWVRRDPLKFDRDGTEALCSATVFRQPSLNQWFESNNETLLIGFNSKKFDDKLLQANGINIKTDYDLLEEIRLAAFGSTRYQDTPKGCSYTLGKIGEANGFPKTGSGELAPVLWQQGQYEKVVLYCLNDVKITHDLLLLGWAGRLIDPNTGKKLRTRSLDEVLQQQQILKHFDRVVYHPNDDEQLDIVGTIVDSQCSNNNEILFRVQWDNGKSYWINESRLVLA